MSNNKVAVITGAGRRIGAALARKLHSLNYTVLVHCNRSRQAATELVAELNQRREFSADCIVADLLEYTSTELIADKAKQTWGRCDVLINNASAFYPTPVATSTEQQWNELIGSNLKAPFFLSKTLHPLLKESNGCIINIADINGFKPLANHSIYSIAKAGNIMLTKSLALEFAPEVRVNGIAPGAILWPEDSKQKEVINTTKLDSIPLGKLGGLESIVNTTLFLIEKADYVSGEIITVDGGQSIPHVTGSPIKGL